MTDLTAAPQLDQTPSPGDAARSPRRGWSDAPPMARRAVIFLVFIAAWATYMKVGHVSKLQLASPQATVKALWHGWTSGQLASATGSTLAVLLGGIALGAVIAVLFTLWSTTTVLGRDVVSLLTALINPIPTVALVPLALIWFGVTPKAVLFVTAESIVWPLTISLTGGVAGLNPTLAMVGRNLGLRRLAWARSVLLPATLPSITSGLEIGWAAAWRSVIAAELVFGTAGGNGGIGFYINTNQYFLRVDNVFAGLVTVGLIGIAVQLGFRALERRTTVRWGMTTRH